MYRTANKVYFICLILSYSPPSEVMSTPVVVFRTVEKIGRIVKIIEDENAHNGFPVVEDYDPDRDEFVSRGHGWGGVSAGRICRQVCMYGVRFGASRYQRGSARGEFRQDYGDGLLFCLIHLCTPKEDNFCLFNRIWWLCLVPTSTTDSLVIWGTEWPKIE